MEGSSLNPIDLIVVATVLVSALIAFARGFVREVLSLAGWIGAALVTLYAFPYVAPYLRAEISNQTVADGATGLLTFTLALIVFSLLTHMISGRVKESSLSAIDRSLGFAFGVLRGALLVSLGYLFALWLWQPDLPGWLQEARTRPFMAAGAEMIEDMLPSSGMEPAQREAERQRRRIEEELENQRRLERLSNPEPARPANAAAQEPNRGYNNEALGRLDQLIKNTDSKEPVPTPPAPANPQGQSPSGPTAPQQSR